jgi:cytochrome c5
MLLQLLRGVTSMARRLATVAASALLACSSVAPPADGLPYLDDASFRRTEMLASLVNPEDGYAKLRIAHYCTGDDADWDRLAEWNPPTDPVRASELDAPGGVSVSTSSDDSRALSLALSPTGEDDPALVELGRIAFERYPVQPASFFAVALASRVVAARYGVWVDDVRGVGGLVRARISDGSTVLELTCSTCHTARVSGSLVDGRPNASLEIGAAMLDAARGPIDPVVADAVAAWGPGRLDVSTQTGREPARIPDLRPVAWLDYLQQDATVRKRDATGLAERIETLITPSQDELVRPPRLVSLALAAYVTSLAETLPSATDAARGAPSGSVIFDSECASCHVPPAFTGAPVLLAVIGTDPTLGESRDRGTGTYRVPSLHGVGSRGPLLHDGTVPSVAAMFDPARPTSAYRERLHGAGAVPGHVFGLDLDAEDREALVAYVSAL